MLILLSFYLYIIYYQQSITETMLTSTDFLQEKTSARIYLPYSFSSPSIFLTQHICYLHSLLLINDYPILHS